MSIYMIYLYAYISSTHFGMMFTWGSERIIDMVNSGYKRNAPVKFYVSFAIYYPLHAPLIIVYKKRENV